MKKQLLLLFTLVFNFLFVSLNSSAEVENYITLTEDGAWCWFADPRAVYYEGEKKQTYISWINSQGDIMIASYNHDTNEYKEKVIHSKLEIDDHDVPAILIREDGRIVVFYSKHQYAGPMQRVISTNPEDISSFSSSYTWGSNVSYPNPFQVGDSICLLYRGINWHPTIAVSTNNGQSFTDVRQLVLNGGDRPYARYCQSADGAIHVAVTTGHPRNESKNQIFYFKLKDNHFYRADGTLIKEFIEGIDLGGKGTNTGVGSEAEIVYNGTANGRGWIWDITIDPETQNPVMVYASFPTDSDHRYNYAYWDDDSKKWVNKEIVKSGKWFPQTPSGTTEREPHYSGGLSMDHNNPSVVYLSKQVNGVFEIYKYETSDKGDTWVATAITENTPSDIVNVRPIVPRNHKEGYFDVIWMRGKYGYYYQDFKTSLVFQMSAKTDNIESISLDKSTLDLTIDDTETLTATLTPLISNNNLTWTSSAPDIVSVENGKVKALALGTAEITVETVNGKSATCSVTVNEITYLTEAFFDFGTDTSPLATGAIKVSENTKLSGSYGWLDDVISRNRTTITDSEKRDFIMNAAAARFKVIVENGTYDVTIMQGDNDYAHDNMRTVVNGVIKISSASNGKGEFTVSKFKVDVENNEMEFKFSDLGGSDANWVVNSIKLERDYSSIKDVETQDLLNNPESEISIFNVMGNLIAKGTLGTDGYSQFLSKHLLPKGIYIIQIKLRNQIETIKTLL
ncbi:BNR-4 repeat-containing protein [Bacteroidales bacterium OttesenSCG-928-A17]|nr:BNR-4 repeat-containing protein [Bacteroidales bacterium OttesenSCG-928-A17]